MATGRPPPYAPFVCAGVAAVVELSIMQPLDVVKTRMHLQGLGVRTGDNFSGTYAAVQGIRSSEGLIGLWRGFVPGLCVVIPRRGFKFVFYDTFIGMLWSSDRGKAPFAHSMVAGGLAGATEACAITPLECIKIAMQSEKATSGQSVGTVAFAAAMLRSGGARSLYSGLAATMAKHSAHSMFYFAAFHQSKKLVPAQPSPAVRILSDLAAGFVAGCVAATANNPFDVVKTRMQVGAASGVSSHAVAREFADSNRSALAWARELVATEGMAALYKGYGAKVLRLGPGSAIIFSVYEQLMRLW